MEDWHEDLYFEQFIEVNQYVNDCDFDLKSPVIIVDLSHDWIEYLIYSLILAKSIQSQTHERIVGVCIESSVVSRSCPRLNPALVRRLAESFGVHEVHSLTKDEIYESFNEALQAGIDKLSAIVRASSLLDAGQRLDDGARSFLLCAYESYLRSELVPNAEKMDRRFLDSILEVGIVDNFLNKISNRYKLASFVVGHIDYNPWRLICAAAARQNIPVYHFFAGRSVSVWKLAPQVGEGFGAAKARVTAAAFDEMKHRLHDEPHHDDHATILPTRGAGFLPYALASSESRGLVRERFVRRYGWDADRPIVTVFAHTFSDIPLSDDQVFRDHAEWIAETVEFAVTQTKKNWIFRAHPLDHVYDRTDFFKSLKKKYASMAHIIFDDGYFTQTVVLCASDLVVTVRGTIGIEAVAAGIPCLLAGSGPYSKVGFSDVASSKEHYFAVLASQAVPPVSPEKVNLARKYMQFEGVWADVQSEAVPPIGAYWNGAGTYFKEATARMMRYAADRDPFVSAIHALVDRAEGRATWGVYNEPSRSLRRYSRPASAKIYFSDNRSGARAIVDGFHRPEESGVWQSATASILLLPCSYNADTMLHIVGRKLCLEQSIYLRAQTGELIPIGLEWSCEHFESTSVPLRDLGGECKQVVLEFVVDSLFSPVSIGINTDERPLGFCLQSIEIVNA